MISQNIECNSQDYIQPIVQTPILASPNIDYQVQHQHQFPTTSSQPQVSTEDGEASTEILEINTEESGLTNEDNTDFVSIDSIESNNYNPTSSQDPNINGEEESYKGNEEQQVINEPSRKIYKVATNPDEFYQHLASSYPNCGLLTNYSRHSASFTQEVKVLVLEKIRKILETSGMDEENYKWVKCLGFIQGCAVKAQLSQRETINGIMDHFATLTANAVLHNKAMSTKLQNALQNTSSMQGASNSAVDALNKVTLKLQTITNMIVIDKRPNAEPIKTYNHVSTAPSIPKSTSVVPSPQSLTLWVGPVSAKVAQQGAGIVIELEASNTCKHFLTSYLHGILLNGGTDWICHDL